jgi:predicted PurR-regulated permease PerM
MTQRPFINDITRSTLAVLFIGIIIAACFWILRPFLTAMIWAAVIVVATWPNMLSLQALLWGKRGLAVAVMTVILLLVLIVPITIAITTIVDKVDVVSAWIKSPTQLSLPGPPDWLGSIPFAGPKIFEKWQQLAAASTTELAARVAPHATEILRWLVDKAGSLAMLIVQFLLTVIICAIFYSTGEKAAAGVCRFVRRLAGEHGENVAILASKAVRGVALGIVVTALVQSILGGIGLAVCGVPAAAVLTAIMFMLCLAQIGPFLVLFPAVAWLYWQDQAMWGTIMLVVAIFVGSIDNFLRPFLIKKGADLPLLLIFAGVIGGLLGFGIIGLFIGPVTLAVAHTLVTAWIEAGNGDTQETVAED